MKTIAVSLLVAAVVSTVASAAPVPTPTYGRIIRPGVFRPEVVPPLFFREDWKALPGKPIEAPLEQANLTDQRLELRFQGPFSQAIVKNGSGEANDPFHIWTGLTQGPSGLTFRDPQSYVDLTGGAMIRWYVWVNGVHRVYPLVKLADGTMLMGDIPSGTLTAWHAAEVSIKDLHWFRVESMDYQGRAPGTDRPLVTRGGPLSGADVDLSRVDEVGFMDPIAGSGHMIGGAIDVGWVEVYGKPVKR